MSASIDVAERTGSPAGRDRRPRLARDLGKLWTAAALSNLPDGLGRVTVPSSPRPSPATRSRSPL